MMTITTLLFFIIRIYYYFKHDNFELKFDSNRPTDRNCISEEIKKYYLVVLVEHPMMLSFEMPFYFFIMENLFTFINFNQFLSHCLSLINTSLYF